jgi:hypothetical protein
MAPNEKRASLELESEEQVDERTVYLEHGRSLAVTSSGLSQLIEIRAASGQVELRIRMTEDGPVLQLDGVKLEVRAEDTIELSCREFKVDAAESVEIASQGGLRVGSKEEMTIESEADVRVRGEKIWLN